MVIVCTPVGQIVEHVRQAAQHCPERTLITDAGSTKQSIVAALDGGLGHGCRFLGGHPLAGSEKTGATNASADLFEGRPAILTPTKNTRAEDFDLLEQFWQSLGSVVVKMTPEEHDQAMAVMSHLPHIAAAALVLTVPEEVLPSGRHGHVRYDPGGRRAIRGSGSRFSTSIATTCSLALERYGAKLAALHAALRDDDQDEITRFLTLAKKGRDALGS